MNRIDRLFATLLLLQNKAHLRAEDLARQFEISKRTVYRDVAALSEMGVPIVTLPGKGYELMEGFYLPPLVFTQGEASALFLGANILTQQATGPIATDANTALAKIAAILPEDNRQRVERLVDIIRFITPQERFDLDDSRLLLLQQAILEQRVIYICYHSFTHNEITKREVEPYRLFYNNGIWYMEGYCRLREDVRGFRLDRMDEIKILDKSFISRSLPKRPPPEKIVIRVCFDREIARWVRERPHYTFAYEEESSEENGVIMVFKVGNLSEMISWLLSWGASAEVLHPLELRQKIRQEALKLVDKLS